MGSDPQSYLIAMDELAHRDCRARIADLETENARLKAIMRLGDKSGDYRVAELELEVQAALSAKEAAEQKAERRLKYLTECQQLLGTHGNVQAGIELLFQRAEAAEARAAALAMALQVRQAQCAGEWHAKAIAYECILNHNRDCQPCKEIRAALTPSVQSLAEQARKGREDTELLDWWEQHLNWEHGLDYEEGDVKLFEVVGNINDREWHYRARGKTLRDALRSAKGESHG